MTSFVHLDFKGLPLAPDYVCDVLLPLIARHGATGVLLEWEDMLPFEGGLKSIPAPHAYTKEEVARLLTRAGELGLEIVPLVQSVGHLEYVLKHGPYSDLREDPLELGTICPADPRAHKLVRELIGQVLSLHPNCRKLHIGCDEPALGTSALTRAAAKASADGLAGVLVDHVARTVGAARELSGGRLERVLMWHDAAVAMDDACLTRLLHTGATLVIWDYTASLASGTLGFKDRIGALGLRQLGSAAVPYVASAYKGAEACDAIVPDAAVRAANQSVWRSCILSGLAVHGVVLTGWSRFGHLMPLCEMLPAGVPTLLSALAEWSGGEPKIADEWIAAWHTELTDAPKLCGLCTELDAARRKLDAIEAERKQLAPPASARAPSPRLLLHLIERADALAAELRDLDTRATTLLSSVFRRRRDGGLDDVDEWRRARITDAIGRADAMLEQLRRNVRTATMRHRGGLVSTVLEFAAVTHERHERLLWLGVAATLGAIGALRLCR